MEERVQKIICNAGYCSRRKAEELIADGKVLVNGKKISLGDKADLKKDKIFVNGKIIKERENHYYLLNKPRGYITALSDQFGKRTIVELLQKNGIKERLMPVGRLDYNTEGLLLLTNDGDFANKVMHPRYETQKTYEAELNIPLREEDKIRLQKGVVILDRKTYPAKIKIISTNRRFVEIMIHEGRNRIIRRMFKKLGYSVTNLKRTMIGELSKNKLKTGQIRLLSKVDVDKVFSKKSF